MEISLILAHPRADSLCHAIAHAAAHSLRDRQHAVAFHDLYSEGFSPLIAALESRTRVSEDELVELHCAEIARADGLVIVHPNWWGMPPAILTGWINRVIRPAVAYQLVSAPGGARTEHRGLLQARRLILFNTSDTPLEVEERRFGNTLSVLWKTYVADLCGIPEFQRMLFSVVQTSTPEQRQAWLATVEETVRVGFAGSTGQE